MTEKLLNKNEKVMICFIEKIYKYILIDGFLENH